MTEDSHCAREDEKLNCVVLIAIITITIRLYVVNHHLIRHNFIFSLGLSLDVKKLASASALTSKLWLRSRPLLFKL